MLGGAPFEDASVQNLPHLIAFGLAMPAGIAVSSDIAARINWGAMNSDAESAGAAIALAIAEGASIDVLDSSTSASLSTMTRSQLIKGAIAQLNIEDFFPDHPWNSHKEESLAACFHTLAALFMRLGDTDAAEECIIQGDQFEDSPRALALKALLSKLQGETLGAVANMVSSLQQYEQRKADNGSHYLAFKPNNIEVINYRLKEGLEALNKRDNEEALSKFTEAVFNFDPFYSEMGLDKLN